MKCIYCGSDDLKVNNTYSNEQSIQANRIVDKTNPNGEIEVVSEPFDLSVTRRKIKCNCCGQCFWTIEHFERTSTRASKQQFIITNLTLVDNNSIKSTLTEDEKANLTKLIQEEL